MEITNRYIVEPPNIDWSYDPMLGASFESHMKAFRHQSDEASLENKRRVDRWNKSRKRRKFRKSYNDDSE